MRIIAGTYRSRPIQAPPGLATRPTSDRLRETLFNVLAPRIEGATFLDLYAGSGAVGLEALSRGAGEVVFVEHAPAALKVLRANLASLKIGAGFSLYTGTVRAYRARPPKIARRFDLVFLDPPYDAAEEYASTLRGLGAVEANLLAPGVMVIAEHRRKVHLDEQYGSLIRTRLLEQGDAALSFFERASAC
jgi:16S rRNA (guanine966-N2)-methyltransferase